MTKVFSSALYLLLLIFFAPKIEASSEIEPFAIYQLDSLIQEKSINNNLGKLDLLVLYQDALKLKPTDSLFYFKNLALLNAELYQPEDAKLFSEKYILNTLDFEILKNSSYNPVSETAEYLSLSKKYLPQINTLTFIYLGITLIGFFLGIVIGIRKGVLIHLSSISTGLIALISFFVLDFVFAISNLSLSWPHIYRMASFSIVLFGPLLFFFFNTFKKDFRLRYQDSVHFIPALFLLVFLVPLFLESSYQKLNIMLGLSSDYSYLDEVIFALNIMSLIFYAFYIGRVKSNNLDLQNELSQRVNINKHLNAIHVLYISFGVTYVIPFIVTYFVKTGFSYAILNHIQFIPLTLLMFYVAYTFFNVLKKTSNFSSESVNKELKNKYEKSGLTPGLSIELREHLVKLFVEEKIYKESNINLEILSNRLDTTRHNASQIINEHFKMNFFELINTFRIKEAIKILENDVYGNLNIIDVAYEVGYNNKVTFNKAFKKETSLTPSEYIQITAKKLKVK